MNGVLAHTGVRANGAGSELSQRVSRARLLEPVSW